MNFKYLDTLKAVMSNGVHTLYIGRNAGSNLWVAELFLKEERLDTDVRALLNVVNHSMMMWAGVDRFTLRILVLALMYNARTNEYHVHLFTVKQNAIHHKFYGVGDFGEWATLYKEGQNTSFVNPVTEADIMEAFWFWYDRLEVPMFIEF